MRQTMTPSLCAWGTHSFYVVGIWESNKGHSCVHHKTCGMQVEKNSKVIFWVERVVYHDQGHKEDAIAVYLVKDGLARCKVVLLLAHLSVHPHNYKT
jgi:hypothetical protein